MDYGLLFLRNMKKVAFYTLGCKLNYAETSSISREFEAKGYRKVDFADTPDIFIINTCSVTENADRKCRKIVREARAISPEAYVAIIGCYAQLKPKEITEIPGIDAVLGAKEKFRLLELLDGFIRPAQPVVYSCDIDQVNSFHSSYSLSDRTRTFLKVQDGCDYSCSFCTIPQARGSSRSNSVANVVKLASDIAATGVKEIVLTGVNTGDFGLQQGERKERFIDLIQALDSVSDIDRFRISSIEPNLLTNEIIEFVATSKRFVPHFHIPLQSGSNRILKLMRRRYQRELYVERVEKVRREMPHACIGVDVIVGFPGETDEDFLETYHFLNELDISYLHVFTYSEREGTLAATMQEVVPMNIRHERSRSLHNLSDKKRRAFYEAHNGSTRKVLFENDVEGGRIHGFTDNYIRVAVPADSSLVNQVKEVRIEAITADCIAFGVIQEPAFA
jgi:threonylcarbamoyladenosine tRNA methylthiotransferase MtaB